MEKSSKNSRSTAATRQVIATAAALWMMGTPVLTACSSLDGDDTQTQNVYCVDNDGNVIDPDYCDDDHGYFYGGYPTYLWVTSVHHDYGYHVPTSQRHGGSYFQSRNTTARQNAGLPSTGRPSTTVRRFGGFGTSHGSSNSGRSSSGGSSSHGFGGHSSGG
jgi:uncharacterized membrane protein YgcG